MVIRDIQFPNWQLIILTGFVEIQALEIPYVITNASATANAAASPVAASAIYRFPTVQRSVRLALTRHHEASIAVFAGVAAGSILLLLILILVLWSCGFFKRKQKHGVEDANK